MSPWSPKAYQVLAILENPTFKSLPKARKSKISQNVGRTYREASGEHCKTCAKWLRNSPGGVIEDPGMSTREAETPPLPSASGVGRTFQLPWSDMSGGEVDTLIQEYGIQHHRSSAYRLQTNRAVEVANKNVKRILRKMVETSWDWSEKLLFALWASSTSFRTSTGATPYSLVYGMEAVLSIYIEMGSLRVALER
ncbi:hypothetical protein AAG906_008037 [Vitis piasezkii]